MRDADPDDDRTSDSGSAKDAPPLKERVMGFVATVQKSRAVRAFLRYLNASGPILAAGLAFRLLFAVFAGLWVGFAIIGTIISGNIGLRQSIIEIVRQSVPGLIDDGTGSGLIDPDTLLSAQVFGGIGIVALIGLILTALGFLNAARGATRQQFGLPPAPENFLMSRLRDLGLALGFGVLVVFSAVLSVVGTQATSFVLELLSIDDSTLSRVLGRIVTLGAMFLVDVVTLATLFRVLSEVRIPWRHLRTGAIMGAIGLGGLKVLGGLLLGGASSNPLLASFAVLLGLLLWFNFVCQVILITGAWIATSVADDGIILDEEVFAARLEAARALVREHGMGDEEPEEPGFWERMRRRFRRE